MKKIRVFERKYYKNFRKKILTHLNMNRSAESDYMKYVNNETLYNSTKIPRFDNFTINFRRNHFLQASKIS